MAFCPGTAVPVRRVAGTDCQDSLDPALLVFKLVWHRGMSVFSDNREWENGWFCKPPSIYQHCCPFFISAPSSSPWHKLSFFLSWPNCSMSRYQWWKQKNPMSCLTVTIPTILLEKTNHWQPLLPLRSRHSPLLPILATLMWSKKKRSRRTRNKRESWTSQSVKKTL